MAAKPSFEEQLADAILSGIEAQTADLRLRVVALEARHAAPAVKYAGIWRNDVTYETGDLVTKNGGLWLAIATTSTAPGGHPESWRLIVKSGGGER